VARSMERQRSYFRASYVIFIGFVENLGQKAQGLLKIAIKIGFAAQSSKHAIAWAQGQRSRGRAILASG